MSPPTDNRLICPRANLTPSETPPSLFNDEVAFFTSIPWIQGLLNAPDAISFLPACRNPLTDVHDQLFGRTLATNRAIQHMLCVFRAPSPEAALDPTRNITEVDTFVSVGHGVSGFPNVVHGGIVASLLDESMGCIFDLNISLGKAAPTFQTSSVTGGLDVRYLRPVPTNSILRITAKVESINGRKTKIQCQMANENGEVLAKCDSTWVATKPNL